TTCPGGLPATVAVYSVAPPSLSMIRPRITYVPGPGGTNVAVELVVGGPNTPVPRSYWYVNPAAVSVGDGSNWFLNATGHGWPGTNGPVTVNVAVGATLLTVIVVV